MLTEFWCVDVSKRALGRPRKRLENNIKINLRDVGSEAGW